MSQETETDFNDEELSVFLEETSGSSKIAVKRHKCQQGIIGFIRQNPGITIEEMTDRLDANERTIKRDIEDLKNIIEYIGPTKDGMWRIISKYVFMAKVFGRSYGFIRTMALYIYIVSLAIILLNQSRN